MADRSIDLTSSEKLGEEIATLAARIDAATHELLVLIRTFDEQEGWNGFTNCAHWLTWRIGLAPNAARERVRVARALGELPLISEAMKRGQLSYSKVRALTRVARPDTEESLVDLGRTGTAAHVERVVRAWRRIDRSVETREDEVRDALSTVSTHIDENGMFVIRGRLAPEAGEVLMKALGAAREKLYDKGADDHPPVGKQRADALALVAESALAGNLVTAHGGDRYQVVVHVNEGELRSPETPGEAEHQPRLPPPILPALSIAAQPPTAGVSAETCRSCASQEPLPAPAAEDHRTETPGSASPPHGAWLGDSHIRVSAETARRVACDAATVQMSHRNGEILSVGRKTRAIPPPIRRALEFRDQGCRFPGCTSKYCDAHHIEHWADGGETKLSNLVLLCRRHHRLLHEGGCSVRLNARGDARFFDRRGRLLEQSPAPPSIGLYAAEDLVRQLEDAGILVTGKESMPAWNGEPLDLHYAMEVLWRPPPHLEAVVEQEHGPARVARSQSATAPNHERRLLLPEARCGTESAAIRP